VVRFRFSFVVVPWNFTTSRLRFIFDFALVEAGLPPRRAHCTGELRIRCAPLAYSAYFFSSASSGENSAGAAYFPVKIPSDLAPLPYSASLPL
jgi:hypothetical protein